MCECEIGLGDASQ